MGLFDLSSNGSLADEAALITALVGLAGLLVTVLRNLKRTSKTVANIDNTLNHIDQPIAATGPTLGQRVKQIDNQVTTLTVKVDKVSDQLASLSAAMLDHITDEAKRVQRLEDQVTSLDRRQDWGRDGR